MRRLLVLAGFAMVLAIALPGSTEAASFSEVKKLTASDAEAGDNFGSSVAVSGDTAIVGALNPDGSDPGAAYVFQRDEGGGNSWGQLTQLIASDAEAGDLFGHGVAVSDDTAVVGAPFDAPEGSEPGAAYVFQRDEGGENSWGEVRKLLASDAEADDLFGFSVAVSGDTAVVGANQEDAGDGNAGAAYVFERNAGGVDNWGEVKKLTASDAGFGDNFAWSVAVSGDTIVVGALWQSAGSFDAGAAYVFQRDEGGADNWGEVKKLTASDAEAFDFLGFSVAVSGDTVVVGAAGEDAGGSIAGAAYVYHRNAGGADNWGEVQKLLASDAEVDDFFGFSVAVSGDTIVVGASGKDAGASDTGAAYVFQREEDGANNWGEVKKLTASDAGAGGSFGDRFGWVAIAGNTVFVGALREDAAGFRAGAAYVFERKAEPPANVPGDANCDGSVNAIDAAIALQFSAGLLNAIGCEAGADVNDDGIVNALDAALILQFTAGLIPSL